MSADNGVNQAAVPNANRLLWAGFMAILAAGVGFAIRSALLDTWGVLFSFTEAQKGAINGAGFTGFCFGIIIGGVIADKIGYGKLVIAAFAMHVLSALVALSAQDGMATDVAYSFLYWGSFIFAVANGTLEAVANPLVATAFPQNRAHYLNILHASWPAGMILGGAAAAALGEAGLNWHWKMQLGLFLVPTTIYGMMFLGQKMPKSEASEQGLSLGEMFKDVGILGGLVVCYLLARFFASVLTSFPGLEDSPEMATYIGYGIGLALLFGIGMITKFSLGSPLLFVLFIAHALVGAVELGTDGWIQSITGAIFTPTKGTMLFIFASLIMFSLRFCAEFIEKNLKLSPVGLLLVCALLACVGLNLIAAVSSYAIAFLAMAVYAFGKTFYWPTMLAVASDRFPRTGAVAISIMGGIGMMSAGLLGSPGLGYLRDHYAGEALQEMSPELYARYKASEPSYFLNFPPATGLDPQKIAAINEHLEELRQSNPTATAADLPEEQEKVLLAQIIGARRTLIADSLLPAAMALIYLGLLLYFRSIGGYRPLTISELTAKGEDPLVTEVGEG